MKKFLAIPVFVCYFAVTSGVIVNLHYCMDRLASMEFFATQSRTCSKCGMKLKQSQGCCKDEVTIIKMNVDQKVSTEQPTLSLPVATIGSAAFDLESAIFSGLHTPERVQHPPPLLASNGIYLQNRVFRI